MSLLKTANELDERMQSTIDGMSVREKADLYEGIRDQERKRLRNLDATIGMLSGGLFGTGSKGKNLVRRMKLRNKNPNAPKLTFNQKLDEAERILGAGSMTAPLGAAVGYGTSRLLRGEPNTAVVQQAEDAIFGQEKTSSINTRLLKVANALDEQSDLGLLRQNENEKALAYHEALAQADKSKERRVHNATVGAGLGGLGGAGILGALPMKSLDSSTRAGLGGVVGGLIGGGIGRFKGRGAEVEALRKAEQGKNYAELIRMEAEDL